eukprot:133581_1
MSFCSILYLLFATSSSGGYVNEICLPDNWKPVEGTWTDDGRFSSCKLRNNMNTNNIAMIMYKSWPYSHHNQTFQQDPPYMVEIVYKFTINTFAHGIDTIGSVGVIWFPNSVIYHYMGLSFHKNEAFASYTTGIRGPFMYDNKLVSWDEASNDSVMKNRGALPFNISVSTEYALRIQIYRIVQNSVSFNIYLNGYLVLIAARAYSRAFDHNTSWIGLKNTNAEVISHELTVNQPSKPDDGERVIQLFESFGAWSTTTTSTAKTLASVTFKLHIHDINLYAQIPSNVVLRQKLQSVIYEYFADYKYSISIVRNAYDSVTSQSELYFEVKKGAFEAWTDDEFGLIHTSPSSPILYKLIALTLDLQWVATSLSLQCNHTTYCDASDLYRLVASSQRQNVYDYLMNIDFADFTEAIADGTTPSPTTASVHAPCITQIEYDVPTTSIRIQFDRDTNYGGLSASVECIDLIINMALIGDSAICQWISRSVLTIAIGMDNTLIENADDAPQLTLKQGIITVHNDVHIQNQMDCLQGEVVFIRKNTNVLNIAADIDGDIRAIICNTLHYTSAGSLGAYGSEFEYIWSINWNNKPLILSNVRRTSRDFTVSVANDILSEIEKRFGIESITIWPILIRIRVTVTNWLGMDDTASFYTRIHNDYSLGVIHVFGPQFQRQIQYNQKHRIRAIASIEICNVSTQHNHSETVYDLLSSQYELEYEWTMMSSTVPDLDDNHPQPDTFATVRGEVLTSTTTTVYIDAYELKPFGKYLFEVKTILFDTQTVDYVSVRVLPPIIYSTPP